MEMWTKTRAGHWKKRKAKDLGSMVSLGGLRGYLMERKEAASSFNARWIVIEKREEQTLYFIASIIFGADNDPESIIVKFLDLAVSSMNHMSVVRVTSGDDFHIAIRIQ